MTDLDLVFSCTCVCLCLCTVVVGWRCETFSPLDAGDAGEKQPAPQTAHVHHWDSQVNTCADSVLQVIVPQMNISAPSLSSLCRVFSCHLLRLCKLHPSLVVDQSHDLLEFAGTTANAYSKEEVYTHVVTSCVCFGDGTTVPCTAVPTECGTKAEYMTLKPCCWLSGVGSGRVPLCFLWFSLLREADHFLFWDAGGGAVWGHFLRSITWCSSSGAACHHQSNERTRETGLTVTWPHPQVTESYKADQRSVWGFLFSLWIMGDFFLNFFLISS